MVQITNALLFAATVAPAFAAPLETREPKFNVAVLKAVGKGVAKATSGADTTANLVSVTPQQPQRRSIDGFEDVEARDPRLSGAQIRQAGRVAGKVASGVGAAATVGSLLMPQQRRSLESREPGITSAQAKSFFKGAVKVGGYAKSGIEFGTTVAPLLPHKNRRSLEDLEVRTFRMPSHSTMRAIGGTVAGAAGFAGTVAILNTQPQHRRELEAREREYFPLERKTIGIPAHFAREEILETRDPNFFSTVAKDVGKVAKLVIRGDEDELVAREPNFFSVVKDVGKVAKFVIREDELDAREPEPNFFRSLAKDVGKVAKLVIREDENGELYVRDLSDEYYLD